METTTTPARGATPRPVAATHKDARQRRRTIARWARRLLVVLFVGGLAAALVVAWLPKPVPVELATVRRGPIRVTVDEDGRTRVKDRYVVSAPLLGNLARIELHPGDAVRARETLVRIVPLAPPLLDERTRAETVARVASASASRMQAQAGIERAQAAVALAESNAARMRQLAHASAAAPSELERADLDLRSRTAELTSARFGASVAAYETEMARAALGRLAAHGKPEANEQLDVPSPIDGRVLRVIHESEGVVQPGTQLLELGDPAALEIVVDVLTSDAVHVHPGARVTIDDWGGDAPLAAHVRLVEPSAFTRVSALGVEEQRVYVVVDLDGPRGTWESLGDGYRVETHIVVWESPSVVIAPASAVFRAGATDAVYVVTGGVAHLRRVAVGAHNGLDTEVLRGLRPGERVVPHPGDRVTDGVRVEATH